MVRSVVGTDSLYFAVDGAPPAAKLLLQRARRADEADSLRKDLLFYGPRHSAAPSIELSPGTELVQTIMMLDEACQSALHGDVLEVDVGGESEREQATPKIECCGARLRGRMMDALIEKRCC